MAQELPEPSLPPPSRGTFAVHSHGCRLPRLFHQGYSQKTRQHSGGGGGGGCVVVVWWLCGGCGADVMRTWSQVPHNGKASCGLLVVFLWSCCGLVVVLLWSCCGLVVVVVLEMTLTHVSIHMRKIPAESAETVWQRSP